MRGEGAYLYRRCYLGGVREEEGEDRLLFYAKSPLNTVETYYFMPKALSINCNPDAFSNDPCISNKSIEIVLSQKKPLDVISAHY